MISTIASVVREGAAAAVRRAIREVATSEADGFGVAWGAVELVPGWLPEASAAVFWGVLAETRPRTIVEIGTYQGRSSVLFGLGLRRFVPGGRVVTVDPHTGGARLKEQLGEAQPSTEHLARAHLAGHGLVPDIVDMRIARSEDEAALWNDTIDLLFIDGWHTYDAAKSDGLAWGAHLGANGLVCFDDAVSMPAVEQGARDAVIELGLTWHGTVLGQAWAGRAAAPPRALQRVLRLRRFGAT